MTSTWEAIALDQGEQVPLWHREQRASQSVKQTPYIGNRSTNAQEEWLGWQRQTAKGHREDNSPGSTLHTALR